MLTSIKPTRGELLRTRKRIVLAKKGHDLLKKKQDSLIIEFLKLVKEIKEHERLLHERYIAAVIQMARARALESDLRITAAAIATQEVAPVEIEVHNIAGVKVPVVKYTSPQQPAYDSVLLQEVSGSYLEVLQLSLELAAKETAMRKMLAEIKRIKRRTYALEHILIPELEGAKKHIQFELEERAREEFSRLKRRKR